MLPSCGHMRILQLMNEAPREKLLDNLLTVFCKEASVFYFIFWGFLETLKNSPYSSEPLSTYQELQDVCSSLAVCVRVCVKFSSVQFSSVVFSSLPPHGLQHIRPPCPSPTPGACSNPCPSSRWCHPAISPPAPSPSQHQGLFQWVSSSHQGAKHWTGGVFSSVPVFVIPFHYSWPGSSIHGIIQGRMVEWVAISSSTGSSRHGDQIHVSCIPCIGRGIH